MKQIPLAAVPAQTLSVIAGNQKTQVSVYQKADALYFDLAKDNAPIVVCRACRNRIRLLLDAKYKGFAGDFVFVDLQGDTQPQFGGLGTRYVLLYLEADDI